MESKNFSEQLPQSDTTEQKETVEMDDIVAKVKSKIEQDGLKVQSMFKIEEVSDRNRSDFNRIWQQVWHQEGFDDGNLGKTISHYQLYDKNSDDLLLYVKPEENEEKIPIGTMRLVWNKGAGLPAFNNFEIDEEWKNKEHAEFTLLTVTPEWRGLKHITSFILWKEGCRIIQKRGIDNIVLVADSNLINLFEKVGFVVHKISPEEKHYEGGLCSVYTIVYPESLANLAKTSPDLHEFFKV